MKVYPYITEINIEIDNFNSKWMNVRWSVYFIWNILESLARIICRTSFETMLKWNKERYKKNYIYVTLEI